MNRKLRNTILAFSVTGTVLALGLIAARPVEHAGGLEQPAIAATPHIPEARDLADAREDARQEAEDPLADEVLARGVESRVAARARQFEEEIARAPSLESAAALAAGFIATAAAETIAVELLSGEPAGSDGARAGGAEPEAAPRKRRGNVRRAVAVPYFSFARAGHGSRS
ncbi:hypothetical protein QF205_00990 [Luteimonas composti]|uniref:Uncharacterized protein n=1 Tax=Luteimonas composti TaxID=398257 RepID=A0ABT6MM23_9GAMM|nr:hypothetical protein [Luteimonas composti]MDH7451656.1 hypothetical protein [Luteimonas composti]